MKICRLSDAKSILYLIKKIVELHGKQMLLKISYAFIKIICFYKSHNSNAKPVIQSLHPDKCNVPVNSTTSGLTHILLNFLFCSS